MNQINPYLLFNGNCAEAMTFYEKTLGGKLDVMTGRQAPAPEHLPPGVSDLVLHARLNLPDNSALMASDWMDSSPYPEMKGFAVSIVLPTPDEARRVFDKLAEGGKTSMPFGKTFWSEGFGMATDRFGVPWMVSGGQQG